MINSNGSLLNVDSTLLSNNRGFLYGDAVFETLKICNGKILFWEDHYFRLMASMRILRMEIPMNFTLEYLENQVINLVNELRIQDSARARITVYRNQGGLYAPETNEVSFIISANSIQNKLYEISSASYEVDLFKDFYVSKNLLSTLKTTNKLIQITGSIYAKENNLNSCLLLNDAKNIAEGLQGNLFMVTGTTVITPPLSEGCLNGIMRKQIISLINKTNYEFKEMPISPFDLQKADELFLTNVISAIQPITKYRKKDYKNSLSQLLVAILNQKIHEF